MKQKQLGTSLNAPQHVSYVNTYMEAAWRGRLLGLLVRCGGFGGLTTAGKGIFLPVEPGESAGRTRENVLRQNETDNQLWTATPTHSNRLLTKRRKLMANMQKPSHLLHLAYLFDFLSFTVVKNLISTLR